MGAAPEHQRQAQVETVHEASANYASHLASARQAGPAPWLAMGWAALAVVGMGAAARPRTTARTGLATATGTAGHDHAGAIPPKNGPFGQ